MSWDARDGNHLDEAGGPILAVDRDDHVPGPPQALRLDPLDDLHKALVERPPALERHGTTPRTRIAWRRTCPCDEPIMMGASGRYLDMSRAAAPVFVWAAMAGATTSYAFLTADEPVASASDIFKPPAMENECI